MLSTQGNRNKQTNEQTKGQMYLSMFIQGTHWLIMWVLEESPKLYSFHQTASLRFGSSVLETSSPKIFKRIFVIHAPCHLHGFKVKLNFQQWWKPWSRTCHTQQSLLFLEKFISQEIIETILSMLHVFFQMFSYLTSIITPFMFLSLTSSKLGSLKL